MTLSEKITSMRRAFVGDLCKAMGEGMGKCERVWPSPCNAVTGRPYRAGNALMLGFYGSRTERPEDNRWCTLHQALQAGWTIHKAASGRKINYFEVLDGENILSKIYVVFHGSEIEGIPPLQRTTPSMHEKREVAERILWESGAKIWHGGESASYVAHGDYIQLPLLGFLSDPELYYTTALHELAHWTGHASRLGRDAWGKIDSSSSAKEELVASIASIFLGGETGIFVNRMHVEDHSFYVDRWISAVQKDPHELFRAADRAASAVDFILRHERVREKKWSREEKPKNHVQDVRKK